MLLRMDLALLALRLVVGLGVAAHGSQKLFSAFGGGGIDGTAASFERLGLRPAKLHAYAAGTAELLGGTLIALGLLIPLAAAALIGVMTTAVLTVHLRNGFFNTNGGYEHNLVLAAAAFALAGVGAGNWSLDGALGLSITGTGWALGALAAGLLGGLGAVIGGRAVGESRAGRGQPHAA
jgi:putative oxidoreductase